MNAGGSNTERLTASQRGEADGRDDTPPSSLPVITGGRQWLARWRRLVVIIVVAAGSVWVAQTYIVKPYRIPSGSMQGTLMVGDQVLVARFWYDIASVGRGDIIVFHRSGRDQTTYIKRVIGLPGEWIGGELGQVWLCHRQPAAAMPQPGCAALHEPYTSSDQTAFPFRRVPRNAYFVMGDNRQNSDDSRQVGPINASRIVGRAFLTYWPVGRIGITG